MDKTLIINPKTKWYKDAVVYQIYPRSFCDTNGDGIGDLRGIISKLDYIKSLGVNAIWLSPIYKSPNDDNGYDISDYRDIMDEFGTLDDFKKMLKGMHDRGIKLIMDLVVNHTSDEHKWFLESKKSKDNPYRDYYIWRDGKGKNPPNNWASNFVGPAWEYDKTTDQYYLHLFSKKQPDLNWENPKVRQEVADICNYWFDLGVDGFRCDVITYISKVDGLPDGNFFKDFPLKGQHNYVMGPRYHEYIHELNQRAFGRYDSMTVGEAAGITFKDAFKSIDESVEELDSVFTFEHVNADMYMQVFPHKLNLVKWKKILSNWQTLPLTSQPTLFLENHDQPRSWPRFVMYEEGNRDLACKMLLVAMQMMRGTAYVYQGQEIGMTNIKLKDEEYIDIMATRIFGTIKKSAPFLMPIARNAMAKRARDHARTPMQWDDSELTGFTTGKPWMLINPNHVDINVKKQDKDEDSILNFYRKFIHFRIGKDIIISGSYVPYYEKSKDLFVYARVLGKKAYFTICNFKNKEIDFKVPQDLKFKSSKVAITNYKEPISNTLESRKIAPFEAVVYELELE